MDLRREHCELKLAEKVGFREDGRLREAVFFDNRFRDLVVLGMLKNEYKPAKS